MNDNPADVGYEVVASEPRWTVIGHTHVGRVLRVTWTLRRERIRIVTAWQATKRARNDYFRAKGIL